MANKTVPWMGLAALTASVAIAAPAPQPPKSVAAIPLDQCTPQTVTGMAYVLSSIRQGPSAEQSLKLTDRLRKLMDQLPKSDRPVKDLMNADQSAEFAQISAQMRMHAFGDLAESGLQRDARVMGWTAEAIEKLRSGIGSLKTKDDPGADGAALIGLMRETLKNDQDRGLTDPAPGVCSIDLALFRKEQATYLAAKKLYASPEFAQLLALRSKYKIPNGQYLDPGKLPSPDKEKAIWLNEATEPIWREATAVQDWENLRLYAKVSELEYQTMRDDLIAGSGATDYDYDTGIKAAYKAAALPTKHMIDAWNVIDKNVPSDQQKMIAAMAATNKAASGSTPTK